jgi:hypothetical protein
MWVSFLLGVAGGGGLAAFVTAAGSYPEAAQVGFFCAAAAPMVHAFWSLRFRALVSRRPRP